MKIVLSSRKYDEGELSSGVAGDEKRLTAYVRGMLLSVSSSVRLVVYLSV